MRDVFLNSFNSLQTGRHIPRQEHRRVDVKEIVSIPFKREGIFQVFNRRHLLLTEYRVSIPFKREGIFQEAFKASQELEEDKFQFPSNGKAYSK